ncbi:MAG TPA: hypothetical protein VF533_24460 [Solirubrobacteraceae bacterium]|jgi:hypothetical protein
MSDNLERTFTLAMDDLNAGRLADPEHYLKMVPAELRDELADRLAAAMTERGPVEGIDDISSEAYSRALAAVAMVKGNAGPTGILPGAFRQLCLSRGIEPRHVVDALAARFQIPVSGRPALRRRLHQLQTGELVGSQISDRLLQALAELVEADVKDLRAAATPTAPPRRLTLAAPMGRDAGSPELRSAPSAPQHGRAAGPDPAAELVERLFCGGPDA